MIESLAYHIVKTRQGGDNIEISSFNYHHTTYYISNGDNWKDVQDISMPYFSGLGIYQDIKW